MRIMRKDRYGMQRLDADAFITARMGMYARQAKSHVRLTVFFKESCCCAEAIHQ